MMFQEQIQCDGLIIEKWTVVVSCILEAFEQTDYYSLGEFQLICSKFRTRDIKITLSYPRASIGVTSEDDSPPEDHSEAPHVQRVISDRQQVCCSWRFGQNETFDVRQRSAANPQLAISNQRWDMASDLKEKTLVGYCLNSGTYALRYFNFSEYAPSRLLFEICHTLLT